MRFIITVGFALAMVLASGTVSAQSTSEKWQVRKLDGASVHSLIKAGYELKSVVRSDRRGTDDTYFLQKGGHLVRCVDSVGGPVSFMECQEFVEPYPAPPLR